MPPREYRPGFWSGDPPEAIHSIPFEEAVKRKYAEAMGLVDDEGIWHGLKWRPDTGVAPAWSSLRPDDLERMREIQAAQKAFMEAREALDPDDPIYPSKPLPPMPVPLPAGEQPILRTETGGAAPPMPAPLPAGEHLYPRSDDTLPATGTDLARQIVDPSGDEELRQSVEYYRQLLRPAPPMGRKIASPQAGFPSHPYSGRSYYTQVPNNTHDGIYGFPDYDSLPELDKSALAAYQQLPERIKDEITPGEFLHEVRVVRARNQGAAQDPASGSTLPMYGGAGAQRQRLVDAYDDLGGDPSAIPADPSELGWQDRARAAGVPDDLISPTQSPVRLPTQGTNLEQRTNEYYDRIRPVSGTPRVPPPTVSTHPGTRRYDYPEGFQTGGADPNDMFEGDPRRGILTPRGRERLARGPQAAPSSTWTPEAQAALETMQRIEREQNAGQNEDYTRNRVQWRTLNPTQRADWIDAQRVLDGIERNTSTSPYLAGVPGFRGALSAVEWNDPDYPFVDAPAGAEGPPGAAGPVSPPPPPTRVTPPPTRKPRPPLREQTKYEKEVQERKRRVKENRLMDGTARRLDAKDRKAYEKARRRGDKVGMARAIGKSIDRMSYEELLLINPKLAEARQKARTEEEKNDIDRITADANAARVALERERFAHTVSTMPLQQRIATLNGLNAQRTAILGNIEGGVPTAFQQAELKRLDEEIAVLRGAIDPELPSAPDGGGAPGVGGAPGAGGASINPSSPMSATYSGPQFLAQRIGDDSATGGRYGRVTRSRPKASLKDFDSADKTKTVTQRQNARRNWERLQSDWLATGGDIEKQLDFLDTLDTDVARRLLGESRTLDQAAIDEFQKRSNPLYWGKLTPPGEKDSWLQPFGLGKAPYGTEPSWENLWNVESKTAHDNRIRRQRIMHWLERYVMPTEPPQEPVAPPPWPSPSPGRQRQHHINRREADMLWRLPAQQLTY